MKDQRSPDIGKSVKVAQWPHWETENTELAAKDQARHSRSERAVCSHDLSQRSLEKVGMQRIVAHEAHREQLGRDLSHRCLRLRQLQQTCGDMSPTWMVADISHKDRPMQSSG
jgi:hypothetical protein